MDFIPKGCPEKYGTSVSRPTDWQKFLSDLFESIWQVMSVTGEFISIAVIYVGTVVFFAWVFVTIFDDMEEMVHGTPVNLGLDSFSRPEGPPFWEAFDSRYCKPSQLTSNYVKGNRS